MNLPPSAAFKQSPTKMAMIFLNFMKTVFAIYKGSFWEEIKFTKPMKSS